MKVMSENADGNPMYVVYPSTAFKKELKKYKKQPERLNSIFVIVDILIRKGVKGIPFTHKPHRLSGKYKDCLECHIEPDLLLIWTQDDVNKEIILQRIGSHSELF